MKRTPDFDDVFKTMKTKHKELFVPLINELYETNFSMEDAIELLSSEGYVVDGSSIGDEHIDKRESDFLMCIAGRTFLVECQSYEDGSMEIRIAEYAFLAARNRTWKDEEGYVHVTFPDYTVIYVKSSDVTPRKTKIKFDFPDGQTVCYESESG